MIFEVIEFIVGAILIWFFLASLVAHLIIPNQRFQTKIMSTPKIKKQAKKLKGKTKKKTLENVWKFVNKKYYGAPQDYKVIIIPRLFRTNIDKLLDENNYFLACHIQNKIIETLLINSGQFKKEDFMRKHYVTKWLTIHQYLIVRVGSNYYKLDPFYSIFKKLK